MAKQKPGGDPKGWTDQQFAAWLTYPLLAGQTHPYDEWREVLTALRDRLRQRATPLAFGHTFRDGHDFEACSSEEGARAYCAQWTDRVPVKLVPLGAAGPAV